MVTSERISDHVARAISDTVALARLAGERGWVPATSGNFSVRIDGDTCAISSTGGFKGELTSERVMVTTIHATGTSVAPGMSAEGPLHLQLYRDNPSIGAVAHVHSHAAAVISRRHEKLGCLALEGWELLKAFTGVTTHQTVVTIPILANDQDVPRLAGQVRERLAASPSTPGYLIAGHGLYTWGVDAAETRRHLEAFDALLNLLLEEERRQ